MYGDILVQGRYLKEWVQLIPGFSLFELYRISSEGGSLSKLHFHEVDGTSFMDD